MAGAKANIRKPNRSNRALFMADVPRIPPVLQGDQLRMIFVQKKVA
jgi:hypothetical protein